MSAMPPEAEFKPSSPVSGSGGADLGRDRGQRADGAAAGVQRWAEHCPFAGRSSEGAGGRMADRPDTRHHPKQSLRAAAERVKDRQRLGPIAPVKIVRPWAVGVLCWSRTLADFSAPDRRWHKPDPEIPHNMRGDRNFIRRLLRAGDYCRRLRSVRVASCAYSDWPAPDQPP
jgi:hypothetical protein